MVYNMHNHKHVNVVYVFRFEFTFFADVDVFTSSLTYVAILLYSAVRNIKERILHLDVMQLIVIIDNKKSSSYDVNVAIF